MGSGDIDVAERLAKVDEARSLLALLVHDEDHEVVVTQFAHGLPDIGNGTAQSGGGSSSTAQTSASAADANGTAIAALATAVPAAAIRTRRVRVGDGISASNGLLKARLSTCGIKASVNYPNADSFIMLTSERGYSTRAYILICDIPTLPITVGSLSG